MSINPDLKRLCRYPVTMSCGSDVFVKGADARLAARAVNHTDGPVEVALKASPAGVVVTPKRVRLEPYREQRIAMPVRAPRTDTKVQLTATLVVKTKLTPAVPSRGGIGVTEDSMVNHYRDLIVYPIQAK